MLVIYHLMLPDDLYGFILEIKLKQYLTSVVTMIMTRICCFYHKTRPGTNIKPVVKERTTRIFNSSGLVFSLLLCKPSREIKVNSEGAVSVCVCVYQIENQYVYSDSEADVTSKTGRCLVTL